MTDETVFEIAILGRATWNLHSLNNEGTVGNVTEPRSVVLADGRRTDGVSGEMLKHIHAENMWILANGKEDFCEACKTLEPARADKSKEVTRAASPEDAVKEALSTCILCDIHGFLVQRPTVARASTAEFGWALGIPDSMHRDIHLHARHAAGVKAKPGKTIGKGTCDECDTENVDLYKIDDRQLCQNCLPRATTQMIYHRPTRSGIYAYISVFKPWRISLNNVTYRYAVKDEKRKQRYDVALDAYNTMFLQPNGAMTTTRFPHTEAFQGVIVVSKNNFPVPVVSPLREDYREQIKRIIEQLGNENLEVHNFDTLEQFVEQIKKLQEATTPFSMEITP